MDDQRVRSSIPLSPQRNGNELPINQDRKSDDEDLQFSLALRRYEAEKRKITEQRRPSLEVPPTFELVDLTQSSDDEAEEGFSTTASTIQRRLPRKGAATTQFQIVDLTLSSDVEDEAEEGFSTTASTIQRRLPRKGPVTTPFKMSSDDKDQTGGSSTSFSTIRIEHVMSLHPGLLDTGEGEEELSRDEDDDQCIDPMDVEPTSPPVEDQLESQEPSTTVNSTTVEKDELVDLDLTMSASEVTVEENGEDGLDPSYNHRTHSKSGLGGETLPYTAEQKETAMQGNPAFDYRTKLGPTGEEVYAIYKCQKCPTGFSRMRHYLVHLKGHYGNPALKFTCEECDYRAINPLLLAKHMNRHRLQREPHIFSKKKKTSSFK